MSKWREMESCCGKVLCLVVIQQHCFSSHPVEYNHRTTGLSCGKVMVQDIWSRFGICTFGKEEAGDAVHSLTGVIFISRTSEFWEADAGSEWIKG